MRSSGPLSASRPGLLLLAALAACAPACSEPPTSAGTGGSGGSGGGSNVSSSSSDGSGGGSSSSNGSGGGASTGTGGAGGSGGSGPSNVCGNGTPELPEACDDGNTASGDYCAADCLSVTGACGDGVLQANETCDDGTIVVDCDELTNGGDGKCVPAGPCSPGHVNVPGQGCQPELVTAHVHIMVDNTCKMTVMPLEFTVAAGQKLKLSYHNHSADYPVDVWMMYGGGYTDLPPGSTWDEKYEHCFGPSPSEGYADISTACSKYHLQIHCL